MTEWVVVEKISSTTGKMTCFIARNNGYQNETPCYAIWSKCKRCAEAYERVRDLNAAHAIANRCGAGRRR